MTQLMPTEILGWKAHADDESYHRDSICDYLDGAGEVFRCYGFRHLLVRRLVCPAQPDIVIELFDMGSSQDAFGVFTHGRIESSTANIGRDSTYQAGLLSFWKSKYYISVASERETPKARETVMAVGRSIADSIGTDGSRPSLLNCLPTDGLIGSTVRFFHTHVSLNYHYFVADRNILHLSDYTDVVLARYEPTDSQMYLLGVQYPNPQQATAALRSFIDAYLPEATRRAIVRTENGKWTAARRRGKRVLIAFDAPTERRASSLLEAAKASAEARHS